VPEGTKLVAVVVVTAWVHWVDGIGDQPEGPWKDTRYLHLIDQKTAAVV
jgi:hypothetical protein